MSGWGLEKELNDARGDARQAETLLQRGLKRCGLNH